MGTQTMKRITLTDTRDFLVWREGSGRSVEIFDIQVGSERRVGKGRQLVRLLVDAIPEDTHLIFAITREGNGIARDFYNGLGFVEMATIPDFYKEERTGIEEWVEGERGTAVMYGSLPNSGEQK